MSNYIVKNFNKFFEDKDVKYNLPLNHVIKECDLIKVNIKKILNEDYNYLEDLMKDDDIIRKINDMSLTVSKITNSDNTNNLIEEKFKYSTLSLIDNSLAVRYLIIEYRDNLHGFYNSGDINKFFEKITSSIIEIGGKYVYRTENGGYNWTLQSNNHNEIFKEELNGSEIQKINDKYHIEITN